MRRHRVKDKEQEPRPGLHCQGRIWLERDGETFLGFGRVVLLEHIREHGSISRAAQAMRMSYKHAWDLVDSMNRLAVAPLVETSKGGKGGGGARLTEAGEAAIASFAALRQRLASFLEEESALFDL
jgi:molybdate transport system regulatory protein